MPRQIDAVFVPQGMEFMAVQRGLQRSGAKVKLYATPMGPQGIERSLEDWLSKNPRAFEPPYSVLLMGLCGSTSSTLNIGDRVLYRSCMDASHIDPQFLDVPKDDQEPDSVPLLPCDAALMMTLQERLGNAVTPVTAVMCDRMIHRASEKQALAERYGVAAVDMEGYAFLKAFTPTGASVGMLRVVSDDALHDLPDLSVAMTETGTLNPIKLGFSLITQPPKALRLIQGSLSSLKQLENAAADLFTDP
ncbi:MAG: hypothetical protein MH252_01255 [Thermosynechococcaceae cyanobacterium MS004]|nr:hypothetical protein [Thermosynechococcaceae cyanobacterium MS004]